MCVCIYKRCTPGTRDKKYVYRERENNGVVVVIEEKEEEFFEKVQTKKKAKKKGKKKGKKKKQKKRETKKKRLNIETLNMESCVLWCVESRV